MAIWFPATADDKGALLAWATARLPDEIRADTAYPVGVLRGGEIAAVAVYHEWRGVDIEMSIAAASPRWATRQTVSILLGFPFTMYEVRRITARIARRNRRSRRLVEGLGFRCEGTHLDALPGDDAVSYGMTRRWWERSRWHAGRPKEMRKAA